MLTRKELDILKFIYDRIEETGIAPTFGEMCKHQGLVSKAGTFRMVSALEEKGFVRRIHHRARAIEIIKIPDWLRDGRMGDNVVALGTTMARKESFRNRVRSLYNIDGHKLPELTEEQQREFVRDPPRYFINTDKQQSDAIWREIEKRQR
jgi:SOS-response transcriptional repressor LexA